LEQAPEFCLTRIGFAYSSDCASTSGARSDDKAPQTYNARRTTRVDYSSFQQFEHRPCGNR
jgi:hypothetical protein